MKLEQFQPHPIWLTNSFANLINGVKSRQNLPGIEVLLQFI